MRTTIRRDKLLSSLRLHILVETHTSYESYRYVRLTLGPLGLSILSFAPAAVLFTDVPATLPAKNGESVSVTVITQKLYNLISAITQEEIYLEYEDNRKALRVCWEGGHTSIPSNNLYTLDFIEDTAYAGDITITSKELISLTDRLLFILKSEANTPYKEILHIGHADSNLLEFTTLSGPTLCVQQVKSSDVIPVDLSCNISLAIMKLVRAAAACNPIDDAVHIRQDILETLFTFAPSNSIRIYAKSAILDYPQYNKMIPKGSCHDIYVQAQILIDVVNRAATFDDSFISFARGIEKTTIECTADAKYISVPIAVENHVAIEAPYPSMFETIRIRASLLKSALAVFNTCTILQIRIYGPNSPIRITQKDDVSYRQFIVLQRV